MIQEKYFIYNNTYVISNEILNFDSEFIFPYEQLEYRVTTLKHD